VKRVSVCAWGLLLVLAITAQAEPIIDFGRVELMYGEADQEIQFFVTGGDPVDLLIFYVQVGDGGPELRDAGFNVINEPETPGPHITAIDLVTGTIFEHRNIGQRDGEISVPQFRYAEILADTGAGVVLAGHLNGVDPALVATVTFDASMWDADSVGMVWELRLKNTVDTGDGGFSTYFGDAGGSSTVGSIEIVPEPSTVALLALGGLMLLLKVPMRRCGL